MDHSCKVCGKNASNLCSKCKSVYYCGRDHQLEDWKQHKLICQSQNTPQQNDSHPTTQKQKRAAEMIDKDNLKSNESVGTFRWNDSVELINIPRVRFEEIANQTTGEINIQPHQMDGLSFSMTLVHLIMLQRLFLKEKIVIIIMGATGKAEERIFVKTNYFEELTNFFPKTTFKFYFVGPELSTQRNQTTYQVNERLSGEFFRCSIQEFLVSQNLNPENLQNDEQLSETYPIDSTFFLGFNPGFGSGYDLLLNSWCIDLVSLLNLNLPVFFTQANDYSDLRGETRALSVIFEDKINYKIQPQENPFRAATHYHEEGKKESSWSCSNTHFYGIQGWKNSDQAEDTMTVKQVRDILKSQKGKSLLQELLFYLNVGGSL